MDNLTKQIFKALETKTLVFSSQVVADSYIYSYARTYGGAFKDSAISWDKFKELFSNLPKGCQRADDIDKSLFVEKWSQEDPESFGKLRYFANFSYKEALPAFKRSIAQSVSKLCKAYSQDGKIDANLLDINPPSDLMNDIHLIVPAYRKYLQENKLYDSNLLACDFSEAKDYVLVLPRTFRDCEVSKALEVCGSIDVEGHEEDFKGFALFNNSVSEIKSVMREVRALLEEGVRPTDIAVTCADIKAYKPYLEYEADIRDIKLDFQDSQALSLLPPGRFFKSFLKARKCNWDFANMRRFILDSMIPFEDASDYPALISSAIECKLQKGPLERWQQKITDSPVANRLFEAIANFENQIKTDKLTEAFMTLSKALLKDLQWTSKQDGQKPQGLFAAVYGSCIDELTKLEEKAGKQGIKTEEILDIFLGLLDSVTYLENRKEMGLKVYSYPLSAGLCIDHHFVINLSDRAVKCMRDPYPFLSEKENPAKTNISEDVIYSYLYKSSHLSGCEDSFSGPSVMPTCFLEKGRNYRPQIKEDSFDKERQLWDGQLCDGQDVVEGNIPSAQLEGFERTKEMLKTYSDVPEYSKPTLPMKMGISRIKDFETCPYKVYASTVLQIPQTDYEIDMEDAATVGDLLHETVQRALKEAGKINNIRKERLLEIFRYKVYQVYRNRKDAPPKEYLDHIYKSFENVLGEFVQQAGPIADFDFAAMEEDAKGSVTVGNVTYTGRADLVLKDQEGNLAVIDLKKDASNYVKLKNLDKTSLQVAMYALLMEQNPEFGKKPVFGAYYSFKEGKYYTIWPGGGSSHKWDLSLVEEDRRIRLQAISKNVEEGNFDPVPSSDSCTFCPFGTLCRGGFEIK